MTITELKAKRDQVQAEIEADLLAEGIDPEAGDWLHPRNEEWLLLDEAVTEATREAVNAIFRR
ncbi:hypothetical protein ACIBP6_43050 [Nonomuraea terrae]|uniref:hypothetical protein n=1 Tax=Nonomuraea terrae TaxID=2530383 RepID=UPI00379B708C